MESRPTGITDDHLQRELLDHWGFAAVTIDYAPVGFGSHHWVATDATGDRRFVTVDDLDTVDPSRAAAFDALARAFATACTLADRGLSFVVAPLRSTGDVPVRHLLDRYTIAVFPYVDGTTGDFADVMEPDDRTALADVLADLHTVAVDDDWMVPALAFEPIVRSRAAIEDALDQTAVAWTGGPFGEPARQWLIAHESDLRGVIRRSASIVAELEATAAGLVVTHGEPHPGNVIRTGTGVRLIDWDTVGLALPERDLWFLADDEDALARYAGRTGRAVEPRAITLFRDAWALADVAVYLQVFRAEHDRNEDTTHAWRMLSAMSFGTEGSDVRG